MTQSLDSLEQIDFHDAHLDVVAHKAGRVELHFRNVSLFLARNDGKCSVYAVSAVILVEGPGVCRVDNGALGPWIDDVLVAGEVFDWRLGLEGMATRSITVVATTRERVEIESKKATLELGPRGETFEIFTPSSS